MLLLQIKLLRGRKQLYHPTNGHCSEISLHGSSAEILLTKSTTSTGYQMQMLGATWCPDGSRTLAAVQVLGGTAQHGDTDVAPREEDRQHIWQGCLRMMPSLAKAKVAATVFVIICLCRKVY